MSSVVESFFDITTGRNHGVVPTADALRVVLDSGATLTLDKAGGMVRARAGWPRAAAYGPDFGTQPGLGGERTVELAVGDGPPLFAVRGVVDMATGRRFGAVVRMDLGIDAKRGAATAALSYMRLKGSPDGTVPPDGDAPVPLLDGEGEPEVVTENVRVGRVTAVGTADAVEATDGRIDQALSALVGKLVLGESGVEVTEWEVGCENSWTPEKAVTYFGRAQFGRRVEIPLFELDLRGDGRTADEAIAQLLVDAVECMRRDGGHGGRINAVVVRVRGRDNVAGVACLPGRPEPPVGATLVARRLIGVGEVAARRLIVDDEAPAAQMLAQLHADVGACRESIDLPLYIAASKVQWDNGLLGSCPTDAGAECLTVSGPRRLRQAAEAIKQSCALAGLAPNSTRIRVCLLSAYMEEMDRAELGLGEAFYGNNALLEQTVARFTEARAGYGRATLRMAVVPDREKPSGAVAKARRKVNAESVPTADERASRWTVRDAEDASR